MLPSMRTLPSSLLPRFLRLVLLHLLCLASLPCRTPSFGSPSSTLSLSSSSPPISLVQPISSALNTDPLSPSSSATSPSQVVIPQVHRPLQGYTRLYSPSHSHFVSYDRLSPSFRAFARLIVSESIPRSHVEATQVREWKAVMDNEVEALVSRGTWTLVLCLADANIITCKWVFTVKYHPDGTIDRHKARLVACGFTQSYGIDLPRPSPQSFISTMSACSSLWLLIKGYWFIHDCGFVN